jgi:DNA-binding NarL/FixJ family response regulator
LVWRYFSSAFPTFFFVEFPNIQSARFAHLLANNTNRRVRAMTAIKLLIACREKRQASALCAQVSQADASLAVEPTDLDGVLEKAALSAPHVLVLEHLQDQADTARHVMFHIRFVSANTRVLLICDSYSPHSIIGFIQRGAVGCVLSSRDPSHYAKAVRAVHAGESWFGRAELLHALLCQLGADAAANAVVPEDSRLTGREQEILELIGNAMSNKEIARHLKISDLTVKTHLHRIYVKLEKSGRYKAFISRSDALR